MKTLPIEFTKHGFTHRQVFREGNKAIYERGKPGQHTHFEAIIIGSHNGYVIGGVKVEPSETYPSAEQFGQKAWCVATLERAMELLSGK
jgi:hypothetical protein